MTLPLEDWRAGKLGVPIQVRLSPATKEALAELAGKQGQTLAGMARVLIMQGLIRRRARAAGNSREAIEKGNTI